MGIELEPQSYQVLVAFACYLAGVATLGVIAHRYMSRGSFVKEYFLGNRELGGWVLALTVAATAISGGTFMGFPSLIYSNGWVMALWICSYMVVPLTAMVLLGKRINQVARVTGAVTVPDLFRDRFGSPALGIIATLLILLFLTFNLVAQFKAGGLVLREAFRLRPVDAAFDGVSVNEDKQVVLRFTASDGTEREQHTPLPSTKAELLPERTVVDPDNPDQVLVRFRVGGEELTKRVRLPAREVKVPGFRNPIDYGYLLGLIIFALTVIAYTTYGGFWAVTWTDVLEGLVMLAGVILMAILAVSAVPSITVSGADGSTETLTGLSAATERLRQQDPALVYGPGPGNFLPVSMAFSFFLMWSLMSAGQPSGMVRLMSFKTTQGLRKALVLVAGYYLVTYVSLLIIFVCARAIFPTQYLREIGSEGQPDSIMPAMARFVAHPLAAGLLLAAPYAAIMSTVAAFLLMISSSLVRDIYQRSINPNASPRLMRFLSYAVTATVGVVVVIGALNPPQFLQYIIVFTGSGQGCSFLIPMFVTLYWARATRAGVMAGMLGGFLTVFGLYVLGWTDSTCQACLRDHQGAAAVAEANHQSPPEHPVVAEAVDRAMLWFPGWGVERHDAFAPLYPWGLDPLFWGLIASLVLSVGVSLRTRPDPAQVEKYFPAG